MCVLSCVMVYVCVCVHMCVCMSRAYGGGGFLGFQETPFDSITISKITCLNKYTSINLLASYAYLIANTIQYLSETFMQTGLLLLVSLALTVPI